jgi:cell division septation protein DedD
MNDLADEGFHEIQLSGKQLVFLFMATTIVAVVIFLCGVQVGRGVKSDRVAEPGDSVAAASPPPAAATLSQPAAAGGPPAAEPPAPAPEPDDELSYAKRLQADQSAPPAENLKPRQAEAPAAPPPSVAANRPPPAQAPAPKAASAAAQGAATKVAARPDAPVTGQTSARPGGWIVQLTALQDRTQAAAIAQRLVAKGYPAFVLDPMPGSPMIYRVQVGGYPDREKADQAARRLEKEEQFKTYVRSR